MTGEICVTVVQQQPGVYYGQRKQQSQKRNQEKEKREAQGSSRNFPSRRLTDHLVSTVIHPWGDIPVGDG
jgi:hypothetical protein